MFDTGQNVRFKSHYSAFTLGSGCYWPIALHPTFEGLMNNGAHVLVVSRDQMLLQTRKLILGAIFQVEAAGRFPEVQVMMAKRTFDLIVLCYTLADDEYVKVIALADRQDPKPKILALRAAGSDPGRDGADQDFMVENGPYALLKKTAEMLELHLKSMGRLATT